MKKFAIIYDFDKTLSPKDMQEFHLLETLGFKDTVKFWQIVTQLSKDNHADPIICYLYELAHQALLNGHPLNKAQLESMGDSIEFFDGLDIWFNRINEYGLARGLQVEHYVISSGLKEIIANTKIAQYFREIYACHYIYDDNGEALWPANVVNYTTKTQYIFRINKQVLDVSNESDLNAYTPSEERPVPFNHMIYIADGYTDVPVFKLLKEYGGKSIGVYNTSDKVVKQLYYDHRLHAYFKADYSDGTPLDSYVKSILDVASKEIME